MSNDEIFDRELLKYFDPKDESGDGYLGADPNAARRVLNKLKLEDDGAAEERAERAEDRAD